ncbi:hypothetical protein TNCV_57641 [Trichonephila clavipes]|nr:hypothetical protein TNCV_57641 [Trichonephila clavipes]
MVIGRSMGSGRRGFGSSSGRKSCWKFGLAVETQILLLVEGEERWEAPNHPLGVLPPNWGGSEQNRTVTCTVLKAKANDWRKNSSP